MPAILQESTDVFRKTRARSKAASVPLRFSLCYVENRVGSPEELCYIGPTRLGTARAMKINTTTEQTG